MDVFDRFRQQLAANRAQFYLDIASGPFYGFNRPGAKVSQGVIQNWWRQAMMGSAQAQHECIKARRDCQGLPVLGMRANSPRFPSFSFQPAAHG